MRMSLLHCWVLVGLRCFGVFIGCLFVVWLFDMLIFVMVITVFGWLFVVWVLFDFSMFVLLVGCLVGLL